MKTLYISDLDGTLLDKTPKTSEYTNEVIKKLHENDILIVSAHDKVSETIAPVKLDFTVVYEDDDLIIVDKPPHMPTHPSPGNYDNTLANGLMYYWQQKGENHVFRAVNRLDKDTSGLMCVAKNSHSNALLCEALKNGDVRRKYMAIVCGSVEKDGTVDAPIGREGVIKRCIRADGDYAVTHYRVIERLEGSCREHCVDKAEMHCTHSHEEDDNDIYEHGIKGSYRKVLRAEASCRRNAERMVYSIEERHSGSP